MMFWCSTVLWLSSLGRNSGLQLVGWNRSLMNSCAMAAAKIQHSDLVQHQVGIVKQFREFWMKDHLCDVVLKSSDGVEHRAHSALLSAASKFFKNLLSGSFLEADRVQRGQPVEIAASKAAVSALLDYLYGGQPEVNLEAGLELLRLAEAYDLPKLASAIGAGFRVSLDSNSALQILQEEHGLHALKAACEEKVAEDFETCSQHPDFGKLGSGQLARILNREDLVVSREESVLRGIFSWLKISNDRDGALGVLLQLVDFQSMSIENLLRLGCWPSLVSMVNTSTEKFKMPCKLSVEREPNVHRAFDQRGIVCDIGHQISVPALKLQATLCCKYSSNICVGKQGPFMLWTSRLASNVGNRETQHPGCDSVPLWLESATWGVFVTWPLRPQVRSLWRIL